MLLKRKRLTLNVGNYALKKTKFGHIEVSVTVEGLDRTSERLDEFLGEAVKLYDRVVLGNTKTHNEFQKV